MPLRQPNQIDQTRPDNTQQITQEPTNKTEIVETRAADQTWTFDAGENVSSNLYFGGFVRAIAGSVSGGFETFDSYAVGTDSGNVYVIQQSDGTELGNVDVATDPISAVAFSSPSGEGSDIFALCDDGNLYSVTLNGTQNWSFSVGGTPTSDILPDGSRSRVYVGQPDGLSDEFYAVEYGSGTANWTYTGSGGFTGGIALDSGFVYAGDGAGIAKLDADDGTESWAADPGGASEEIRGKIDTDSDYVYAAFTEPEFGSFYLTRLDKSNGNEDWSVDVFGGFNQSPGRPGVVVDANRVYHYPNLIGSLVARNKTNGMEDWTFGDMDPLTLDTNDDATTEIAQLGNGVFVSAGEVANDPPGDVVEVDRTDGTQREAYDTPNPVQKALAGRDVYAAFAGKQGEVQEYNVANTGVTDPIRVTSRPFLSIGAEFDGDFDLNVYGATSTDRDLTDSNSPDPFRQETLSFTEDVPSSEQVPWWSYEYVQLEIDDPNATAGDVTLVVSASR